MTQMIACGISENGTGTVGTNDHSNCCIAADPGAAMKICKREPAAVVLFAAGGALRIWLVLVLGR
jgi:hypothetical protein